MRGSTWPEMIWSTLRAPVSSTVQRSAIQSASAGVVTRVTLALAAAARATLASLRSTMRAHVLGADREVRHDRHAREQRRLEALAQRRPDRLDRGPPTEALAGAYISMMASEAEVRGQDQTVFLKSISRPSPSESMPLSNTW